MWQMATLISAETPEPASVIEGCRCPWVCTRLDAERDEHDYYEAHEPNLRKAGLPWFYFCPSPVKLVAELQADYIRESEALLGLGHWGRTFACACYNYIYKCCLGEIAACQP